MLTTLFVIWYSVLVRMTRILVKKKMILVKKQHIVVIQKMKGKRRWKTMKAK